MDKAVLRDRLEKCIEGMESMINSVAMEAMANEQDPYLMKDNRGYPLLAPLVVSQTSALMILVALGGVDE